MAMELSSATDAFIAEQRSMEKGILFDELDNYRRVAEEKDTDSEYRHFILLVLGKARENVSHKRIRENVNTDLVEVSDVANDLQYGVNHKADAEEFIRMDKGDLYQMPGRRSNLEMANLCGKRDDPARCREKDKVCSRVYLQKSGKGKNVIGEDGGANRNTVLHLNPSQKNNSQIQYQNKHVDQARSAEKYKEQMGAKFKGRIKVKVELKANEKATVITDNEKFHQGRKNNWVERVDRKPGKKVVVHGQRELIKEGQGKHGLSHQKAAFGNYSVKKETDNGIKTLLHTEEVHKKNSGHRKLMKVGQGDRRFSNQQAAFGNLSVKNEPDDGVKTRLHTEEVHNEWNVKTASGKDVVEEQRKLMKVGQGDCRLSHQKAAFGNYSVKNEPDEGVITRLRIEEVQSKSRSVETSKCPVTYKKGFEMNKKGNVEILPEVEILDSTAVIKGMPSPFVPSTTDNDLLEPGCPTLDDFTKELLEVLNKPYDKEEYKQHWEALRIGSFLKYYPDLAKKLSIHRYRPKKRLTIVRGFFFWLQNVCREGAFQPWKDRQCLAIEPGSP